MSHDHPMVKSLRDENESLRAEAAAVVARLRAEVDLARKVLAEVEWIDGPLFSPHDHSCMWCQMRRRYKKGHKPDCDWARAMGR